MHILITGGAGFLGSHLVNHHIKNNDIVHVVDDLSTGKEANLDAFKNDPNFYFTKADLITWSGLEKAVYWADRIYHMAAIVGVFRLIREPARVLTINIAATERLIRAIRVANWKPRLILASTSEVYGNVVQQPLKEDSNLIVDGKGRNRTNYVISKMAAEALCLTDFEQNQLPVTILRIFNMIGPRQSGHYGMVVPRFIDAAIHNEPLIVFGSGEQKRTFCDVRDFVSFVDKIASNPQTIGQIINVGHDQEISIISLAELILKLTKSKSKILYKSYEEAYGESYDEIMQRRPDLTQLSQFVPLTYQWSLKKTLNDLIAHYQADNDDVNAYGI